MATAATGSARALPARSHVATVTTLMTVVITISFSTKDESERCSSSRHSFLNSRSQSWLMTFSSAFEMETGGPLPSLPFIRAAGANAGVTCESDLALEEERDDEAVNRDRLDEGETDDHRGLEAVGRARVAADGFHRRGNRAALAHAAAESAEAHRETRADADQAGRAGPFAFGSHRDRSSRQAREHGARKQREEHGELLHFITSG